MCKIKSYSIEMRPFGYGTNCYEIYVTVNGEKRAITQCVADPAPYGSELEVLNRMGRRIVETLRDEEKHSDCCDCCDRKKSKCQKY